MQFTFTPLEKKTKHLWWFEKGNKFVRGLFYYRNLVHIQSASNLSEYQLFLSLLRNSG